MSESLKSNPNDREKGKYHVPLYRLRARLRIKWDPSQKIALVVGGANGVHSVYSWSWYKWCDDLRPHCGNLSVLN